MSAEMNESKDPYKSWSKCSGCGFQGLFWYWSRVGENYDDSDLLGALMDTQCPACAEEDTVLVSMDEYQEMVFFAANRSNAR